jgi:DNA ligase-associated metallophosphoesterase
MKAEQTEIRGEKIILLPAKAAFVPRFQTLLIADFHAGKGAHFRNQGIPAPAFLNHLNLTNFNRLLKSHQPQQVIFLGDLFHSVYNTEWESFGKLIRAYPHIKFILVKGNHDILADCVYSQLRMEVVPDLMLGPFHLTHYPANGMDDIYNLAGHIHPGIVLKGQARQSLRMPCFYFSENAGILPAFGTFTGLGLIKPQKNDRVYVITRSSVIGL